MLSAESLKRIDPRVFHQQFLNADVRPDGRGLLQTRPLTVASSDINASGRAAVSSADGSALVKIGKTTVLCGIKLEVGMPLSTTPKDGRLVVDVHLRPHCSPKYTVGDHSTQQQETLAEVLRSTVVNSQMFSLSELCIEEASSCWVLYADIMCLDDDGNVMDAAMTALVAALCNLRLPDTQVDGVSKDGSSSSSSTSSSSSNMPVGSASDGLVTRSIHASNRLTIAHCPIPLTFGMLGGRVIADPTTAEEDIFAGVCTVVYNAAGELCAFYKPGGCAVSQPEIDVMMSLSKQHAVAVTARMASSK